MVRKIFLPPALYGARDYNRSNLIIREEESLN